MIINTIINITLISEVIKVEIKECKGMDGEKNTVCPGSIISGRIPSNFSTQVSTCQTYIVD